MLEALVAVVGIGVCWFIAMILYDSDMTLGTRLFIVLLTILSLVFSGSLCSMGLGNTYSGLGDDELDREHRPTKAFGPRVDSLFLNFVLAHSDAPASPANYCDFCIATVRGKF